MLGGADIAFIVGLAIAAGVYCTMSRHRDHATEARAVQASERALEEALP